ncbi:MAG: hypothetical protein ABEN55_17915 [Bradymonadaceae bacterium]
MGKMKSVMEFFVEIEPEKSDDVPEEAASDDPDVAAKAAKERAQQGPVGKTPDQPKKVREAASDPYAGELDEAALSDAVDELNTDNPDKVFDKIYEAAGLPPRDSGNFTIHKIEKLLNSEHLSGMSDKVKQRSIMVTLESNDKSLDEIIQDAVARDKALDQYDVRLKKDVKDLQKQVEQENSRIQKEIEEYLKKKKAQMEENKKKVEQARQMYEKWKGEKQSEEQRLLEAVSVFVDENPITEGTGDWEQGDTGQMPEGNVFSDGSSGAVPSESAASSESSAPSGTSEASSKEGAQKTQGGGEGKLAEQIEKSSEGGGDGELSDSEKQLLEELESKTEGS